MQDYRLNFRSWASLLWFPAPEANPRDPAVFSPALLVSVAVHVAIVAFIGQRLPGLSTTPVGDRVARSGLPTAGVRPVELSQIELSMDARTSVAVPRKKKPIVTSRPTEPAPASSAASAGTLGNAATGAATGTPGDPNGIAVSTRERYLYELKLFLEQRKRYPLAARELGQSGTVEVAFLIHQDGRLADIAIAKPSAHERLNRAALDLVRNAGVFKALPEEIGMTTWNLIVPIRYELD